MLCTKVVAKINVIYVNILYISTRLEHMLHYTSHVGKSSRACQMETTFTPYESHVLILRALYKSSANGSHMIKLHYNFFEKMYEHIVEWPKMKHIP